MSQIVEIPGQGEVEFPDSMSDADIAAAAKRMSAPQAPAQAPVGAGTAALRGAAQGATMGFGDEAQGAVQAIGGRILPESMGGFGPEHHATVAQDYSLNRNTARAENDAARQQHPVAYTAGDVAGSIAPSLLTGAATGTLSAGSGARLLATLAGQGALQGAGYSDANTARGLAGDSALGGVMGATGYGAGQAVGAVGSKLSGALAGLRARAAARAAAQAAEEEAAKVASLAGKYGGELQKGSRMGENLGRIGTPLGPTEQAAADAIQNRVESGTLRDLPSQAGTIDAREAELRAAQAALPQAVADRTTQLQTPQFGKDAASFFKSYGEPLVWGALGAGAGHAMGLSPAETAMLGTVAGSIGGRTRAGKALMSRLTRPGNAMALAGAGEKVATSSGELLKQLLQRAAPVAATQALESQ